MDKKILRYLLYVVVAFLIFTIGFGLGNHNIHNYIGDYLAQGHYLRDNIDFLKNEQQNLIKKQDKVQKSYQVKILIAKKKLSETKKKYKDVISLANKNNQTKNDLNDAKEELRYTNELIDNANSNYSSIEKKITRAKSALKSLNSVQTGSDGYTSDYSSDYSEGDSSDFSDYSSEDNLDVTPGQYATVTAQGDPYDDGSIEVIYNSGPSTAAGLFDQTADSNGNISWTWKVGTRTAPGDYPINITLGGKTVNKTLHVE